MTTLQLKNLKCTNSHFCFCQTTAKEVSPHLQILFAVAASTKHQCQGTVLFVVVEAAMPWICDVPSHALDWQCPLALIGARWLMLGGHLILLFSRVTLFVCSSVTLQSNSSYRQQAAGAEAGQQADLTACSQRKLALALSPCCQPPRISQNCRHQTFFERKMLS